MALSGESRFLSCLNRHLINGVTLKLAVRPVKLNRITADGKAEGRVEGGGRDAQFAYSVNALHMGSRLFVTRKKINNIKGFY
ncbi:hypothetical protein GCM10010917_19700 [Paenibacillus physcomitrellae]|uniref:Uncharacterized protein n=1 Tax=Paenibacillus physcomitrellae TaxID=1619311 RepID=A0ABQ1FZG6_9BACL|nr:hypothetical protein GCM10010917_19700 [Paenibacillus physcomitrellae]